MTKVASVAARNSAAAAGDMVVGDDVSVGVDDRARAGAPRLLHPARAARLHHHVDADERGIDPVHGPLDPLAKRGVAGRGGRLLCPGGRGHGGEQNDDRREGTAENEVHGGAAGGETSGRDTTHRR
ncbi:MAG: hypothetical protein ACKO6B_13600 [Planctomycetia bacterium]